MEVKGDNMTEYPYNDDLMTYDYTLHLYVLTPKCVMQELGVDLTTYLDTTGDINPSTIANRTLKMISLHLYNYIYSFTQSKFWIEFQLAKTPECRDIIKTCLINEVYYNLKNGDFYNYADNEIPRDKEVSEMTKAILNQPLQNGIKLTYRGYTPFPPNIQFRKDY